MIISGGGTGGHIYPALSIADGIKNRFKKAELIYVGTRNGLEADIVPKHGYTFESISACGLRRKLSFNNIKTLIKSCKGFYQSMNIIRTFKPDLVIGTGGYVCGSIVMAAVISRLPTLIHEQNVLPGITNRLLSKFVDVIAVAFEDSIRYFPKDKVTVTGLPLRPGIFCVKKENAYTALKLKSGIPVMLVFGGSRGAQSINTAMIEVVRHFYNKDKLQIIHVTGKSGYEKYRKTLKEKGIKLDDFGNIKVIPYLYNMQDALAIADLVVCRAGATTIAEITALGLPSILIPYPYAVGNHQELNARVLEERGAAVVISDFKLTGSKLIEQIEKLLNSMNILSNMADASLKMGKPRALEDILNVIDILLRKKIHKLL